MVNKLFSIFAVLLFSWAITANASSLTSAEALQLVKANRTACGLGNANVNFYCLQTDTVVNDYQCPIDMTTVRETWLLDNSPKWLVFVDEEPLKRMHHDCSYYYVNSDEAVVRFPGVLPPVNIESHIAERNVVVDNSNIRRPVFPHSSLPARVSRQNLCADSTYIIMTDESRFLNESMYSARDFSLVYKMLTNVYGINKSHITVNLHNDINPDSTYYDPSCGRQFTKYDFDDDGVGEPIEIDLSYKMILQSRLDHSQYPDCRHLFIFNLSECFGIVTGGSGHGVYEMSPAASSDSFTYINVLRIDDPTVPLALPSEFNNVITSVANLSILNEGSDYNPILIEWVNALSRYDVFSGDAVDSDVNGDGYISMSEATQYVGNQYYTDLNCTSDPGGLADVLSFDRYPKSPVLTIRDDMEDAGGEPNIADATWNSPDIWCRINDDGLTCQKSEKSDDCHYVYVRVHNNSDTDYEGFGQKLFFATALQSSPGYYNNYSFESCDYMDIDSVHITQTIPAHSSAIIKLEKNVSTVFGDDLSQCVVIASTGYKTPMFLHDDMVTTVPPMPSPKEDSRLAMSSLVIVKPSEESGRWTRSSRGALGTTVTCSGLDIPLLINGVSTIEVRNSNPGANDRGAFTIGLEFENSVSGNMEYTGMVQDGLNSNVLVLNGSNATVQGNNLGTEMSVKCYDNGMMGSLTDRSFAFDVVLKDGNGNVMGGASYMLQCDGQGANPPVIIMGQSDGNVELSAANLDDAATVHWYGEDEGLLATGSKLHVYPENAQKFTMIAIEDESGRYAVDSIDLTSYNFMKSASIKGTMLEVELWQGSVGSTSVVLTSTGANGMAKVTPVENGMTAVSIPVADLQSGVYAVSLVVNGNVVNVKSIIK